MRLRLALVALVLASGCRHIAYEDAWMDSPKTQDPARTDASHRVSARFPAPTAEQLKTPVVIAGHGFGGSTYDYWDFNAYLEETGARVLLSRVPLGGHGTDVGDWATKGWRDWRAPLVEEYKALRQKGYERVFMLTSSASGALVLTALADGSYDDAGPNGYYLVAPYVVPSNKDIFQCWWAGWIVGSAEGGGHRVDEETGEKLALGMTEQEHAMFYYNLPMPAVCELAELSRVMQRSLRKGIALPAGVKAKAVRSTGDTAVDPISKGLLEAGVSGELEFVEVGGSWHVFTRLIGRGEVPAEDRARARATFADVVDFVVE